MLLCQCLQPARGHRAPGVPGAGQVTPLSLVSLRRVLMSRLQTPKVVSTTMTAPGTVPAEPGASAPSGPSGSQPDASPTSAPPSSPPEQAPSQAMPDETQDYYQSLYEQVSGKPCKVLRVNMTHEEEGLALRTKAHLIERELERVYEANTLEEIQLALEAAGHNLQQLSVFNRVGILVNEEPVDDPEACTVEMDLREKNWHRAHAATYFQGGESSMELSFGLLNPTGHAEQFTLAAEYGTQLSTHFSLAYQQPRVYGLPIQVEAKVQQYLQNHIKGSSYSEKLRGILLGVRSLNGSHLVQYELGWRSLLVDVANTGASRAVAAQAGDYLKAAARYTYLRDRRNHPLLPNQGYALRSSTEVAGLGPDERLRFVKQQVDVQWLYPLTRHLTLNLLASTGVMLPWGGVDPLARASCIADRFFLGGPSSLRGFRFQGVGPTEERRPKRMEAGQLGSSSAADRSDESELVANSKRDILGGDLYASVLSEIIFPLPNKVMRSLNIHGHVFVNGGSCSQISGTGLSPQAAVKQWASSWRWTTGVGLMWPTWFGKFEVNYVHVLASQEFDRVKRGVQLGFATSPFTS